MRLTRLAWQNTVRNRFRSVAIVLCAALVAGLVLIATFVVQGAEAGLRDNLQRLGADILVLPWGTMTDRVDGVRLMSAAIDGWMPWAYVDGIADVEGVDRVSPQLYLSAEEDSPYCAGPELYLVAYEPESDFVLAPWFEGDRPSALPLGHAVAGAHVILPEEGRTIALHGYSLEVATRLAATGTSIDNTIFVTFETAQAIAAPFVGKRFAPIDIVPNSLSAVMVRVGMGSDPHEVAIRMLETVPGVVPLETPNLFQAERRQMIGVLRALFGVLGVIWALTVAFMGLSYSVAVNERRTEIGVLRALGFTQVTILRSLLAEGLTLALVGGLAGVLVAGAVVLALGERAAPVAGLPLRMPSVADLLSLSALSQLAALASVALAALVPTWRISHQEAALAMRD